MSKHIRIIGIGIFFLFALFSFAFCEEETFTITTYYPSPYGSYNELTTYSNTYLAINGGSVGIGTTNPNPRRPGLGLPVPKLRVVKNDGVGGPAIEVQNTYTGGGDSAIDFIDNSGNVRGNIAYYAQRGSGDPARFVINQGWIGEITPLNTVLNENGGNVGIGTARPLGKLDIQGGADTDGANDPQAIAFSYRTGGYRHWIRTRHSAFPQNNNAFDFYTNTSYDPEASIGPGTGNVIGMTINNGNVGIGTPSPNFKLDVDGDINTSGDLRKDGGATVYAYPDYVFAPGYATLPLPELKKFIAHKKHLPNLPSTEEVKKEGVKIFEQNRLILEKLEEAYLYIIQLEERITKLETGLGSRNRNLQKP